MEFQEFIDRYLLTFEIKRAKKQERLISSNHVVHSVKIKSPILPGKFKLKYQFNPTFEDVYLNEILECIQSDCMFCHDDYAEDLNSFLVGYGYDNNLANITEGTRVWNECVKQLGKAKKFFGEGGLQDLFECVE